MQRYSTVRGYEGNFDERREQKEEKSKEKERERKRKWIHGFIQF
jgi:hypothetical protein